MRPKTPGTHSDDDRSQQPREKETPSRKERREVAKEDHLKEREALTEETGEEGRQDDPAHKKSTGSR